MRDMTIRSGGTSLRSLSGGRPVRRLRRSLSLLVSAAAVLLAMALLPGAAIAAGQISLLTSGSFGDPYLIAVQVNDGNGLQLASLTVHIYSGTTDVYDVTDMAYWQGPASDQTWVAANPIPQADLPAGTYTTRVDATDADETDSGLTTGQQFDVAYTVTLTATPHTVSYGDSTITMSGQVTGVVAGSPYTTPVGLAGVTITFADNGGPAQTIATTQSDGSYSAQVTLPVSPDLCATNCSYFLTALASSTEYGTYITPSITWAKVATRLVSVKVAPEDFIRALHRHFQRPRYRELVRAVRRRRHALRLDRLSALRHRQRIKLCPRLATGGWAAVPLPPSGPTRYALAAGQLVPLSPWLSPAESRRQ